LGEEGTKLKESDSRLEPTREESDNRSVPCGSMVPEKVKSARFEGSLGKSWAEWASRREKEWIVRDSIGKGKQGAVDRGPPRSQLTSPKWTSLRERIEEDERKSKTWV